MKLNRFYEKMDKKDYHCFVVDGDDIFENPEPYIVKDAYVLKYEDYIYKDLIIKVIVLNKGTMVVNLNNIFDTAKEAQMVADEMNERNKFEWLDRKFKEVKNAILKASRIQWKH